MNRLFSSSLGRTYFAISIFCMVIVIILLGKPLLAPIALSCILAFVLAPVVRQVESIGIGRLASVLVVVMSLTIATALLGTQLFSQLNTLVTELPQHKEEIEAKLASFRFSPDSSMGQIAELSKQLLGDVDTSTSSEGIAAVQKVTIVDEESPISWITSAPQFIGDIVEPLASAVVVIVLVLYILISREDLRNRFLALIGNRHLTSMTTIVNESSNRMGNYLLGLVSVNFGFAICFGIALYLLHVPYAALWGAVTFVFRFVPLLGSFVSMLMPVSVSLLFMPGWFAPVSVVVIYLTLELITGNLLEPWLFGKSVGMNPFALLIAIMFWTWAWGPIGLVMATPLSLILATLGRHLPYLKSFDFLLSDSRPLPAHLIYFQRLLANDIGEAEALLRAILLKRGLPFVVDKIAIRSLNHSDRERSTKKITNELHGLIGQRSDAILWKIMAEMEKTSKLELDDSVVDRGQTLSSEVKRQKAFGISLGGERTDLALRAVAIACPQIELSVGHSLGSGVSKRIATADYSFVIISSLPKNPWEAMESFSQRLRRDGFKGWIAVGNWRLNSIDSVIRRRLKEAGVDYASHRLHAYCRMLSFASEAFDDTSSVIPLSIEGHILAGDQSKSSIQSELDTHNPSTSSIESPALTTGQ